MLIEFNARFGDPECLNLLSLFDDERSDFLALCEGMACGGLARVPCVFKPLASCCKYAVPEGYPETPLKGGVIDVSRLASPQLAYLGAVDKDAAGVLKGTGSRAIGVVALAADLGAAEAAAEKEVCSIGGELFHRVDIGTEPLVTARVKRMLSLQAGCAADGAPHGRVVRLGVLGSTRGSSLQPVLRALAAGGLRHVVISLVLSNKKDAGLLRRAQLHGLPHAHVPCAKGRSRADYDAEVTSRLEAAGCDAVLCVGYMRILSAPFCQRWAKRALNVHPSLLPLHAGGMDLDVHRAVLEAREAESGCTVHFIEEVVDGGEIVVQKRCPVLADDTPESLKARVQPLEGIAFLEAIALVSAAVRAASPAPPSAPPSSGAPLTYKAAGVDIDAGNALVQAIGPMAKGTCRAGSMGAIGGFGGLFDLKAAGYTDPVLVSGTDGVGTKLLVAQSTGQHATIGIDLVAMVVNDLIVQGAEPLFFLDYFATGKLEQQTAAAVLASIAAACKASGCALVGGETAEMPGMYGPGHYDLGGFAVGAVERADLLPKMELIGAGDVLLGLPSSGVHSNGFSLVRRVVEAEGLQWTAPAPFAPSSSLAAALLTPTVLYVKPCLPAVRSRKVKALAHITGGGLPENLPRVLPEGVRAVLSASSWAPPPAFGWLAKASRAGPAEMLRTFNCGIGMVLVVAPADVAEVMGLLEAATKEAGVTAGGPRVIGKLEARADASVEQVEVQGVEAWGW